MVEEVKGTPFVAASRFRHHVIPCEIYGGQMGWIVLQVLLVFPLRIIPRTFRTYFHLPLLLPEGQKGRKLRTFQTAMLFRKLVSIG
jgi:hypothetical protein